jgi:hypothetical protein
MNSYGALVETLKIRLAEALPAVILKNVWRQNDFTPSWVSDFLLFNFTALFDVQKL